jgi:hypothetical protein
VPARAPEWDAAFGYVCADLARHAAALLAAYADARARLAAAGAELERWRRGDRDGRGLDALFERLRRLREDVEKLREGARIEALARELVHGLQVGPASLDLAALGEGVRRLREDVEALQRRARVAALGGRWVSGASARGTGATRLAD